MSYCRKEGKDQIIFATEEDHKVPSKVPFPKEDEDDKPVGLVLPNGELNWSCPCLGGMATGPCGVEFREAFSCFHYSTAEPKGSDCLEPFKTMNDCMSQYPGLYGSKEELAEVEEEVFKESSLESRNGTESSEADNSNNSSSTSSLVSSNSNSSSTSKKSS